MSSGFLKMGLLVLLTPIWVFTIQAQNFNAYLPAFTIKEYRVSLKDTLKIEVILPREMEMAPEIRRPVLYLFDRQNEINYKYQLQTIDYLTSIGAMPSSVIVGVSFPAGKRTAWTLPTKQRERDGRFTAGLPVLQPSGKDHQALSFIRIYCTDRSFANRYVKSVCSIGLSG